MRVLIDADGCPVVDAAVKTAKKHGLEAVLICDTAHEYNRTDARVVTVSKGGDSADFALVNRIEPGDVVVTQDYGLAAMALARKARPLSQDGLVYSAENMDSLLLARHTARKIRMSGGRLRGPRKRTSAQDAAFEAALEAILNGQAL